MTYPDYNLDSGPQNQYATGVSYNSAGYNNDNALQIRLNTEPLQRQVEMFLRGKAEKLMRTKDGDEYIEEVNIGKPLCNEEGVQNIMLWVELIMNAHVVQANWKDEFNYEEYLVRTRRDLAHELMLNLNNYGINRNHYPGLISKLMRFIEAFMTRPLDNKERDSYAATIRTNEMVKNEPVKKKGWLPI